MKTTYSRLGIFTNDAPIDKMGDKKDNKMNILNFIKKGVNVYHLSYGWGVVVSGESGMSFQVKFCSLREIQSFSSKGVDLNGGKTRSIFKNEVKVEARLVEINTIFDHKLDKIEHLLYLLCDVMLNFQEINNDIFYEGIIKARMASKYNTKATVEDIIEAITYIENTVWKEMYGKKYSEFT